MPTSELFDFIKNLAWKAGQQIKSERELGVSSSFKSHSELVTSADINADRLITDSIKQSYPTHGILSEESAPDVSAISQIREPLWIVDPIDGTVNYAHGHNQSAVSIAYAESGELLFGVVYNPFTDEMFSAGKGMGAWLNEKQSLAVAKESDLARAVIATGFPYDKSDIKTLVKRLEVVLTHCADIRRLGSAALDICWVAMGRLDGYYESLSVWDFAAAQLIAKEAGAVYGHFSEVPTTISTAFYDRNIVVANQQLFPKLCALLQSIEG